MKLLGYTLLGTLIVVLFGLLVASTAERSKMAEDYNTLYQRSGSVEHERDSAVQKISALNACLGKDYRPSGVFRSSYLWSNCRETWNQIAYEAQ